MDRKKLRKNVAAALTMIVCMIQALPVYASGNPLVVLHNAGVDMKERTLQVECNMTNMDQVTNGKLRVIYDADKLRLLENQAGNIVADADALCEINDCLTGNKEEGEIVFAFASAEELPTEGCLANMKFAVADGVEAQEKVEISVFVENMAGNGGNVNASGRNLTVTIAEESQSGNENNEGDDNPDSNGGSQSRRPGITGSSQSGSGNRGGNLSSNITGSRGSSGSSSGSSARSSIKSGTGSRGSDQDSAETVKEENIFESGDGKEDSASDDESRLQTDKDENVPKTGLFGGDRWNEDNLYWLMIPIAVLAVVFAVIVYKKKQKSRVDS